jgi:hypothetical protein
MPTEARKLITEKPVLSGTTEPFKYNSYSYRLLGTLTGYPSGLEHTPYEFPAEVNERIINTIGFCIHNSRKDNRLHDNVAVYRKGLMISVLEERRGDLSFNDPNSLNIRIYGCSREEALDSVRNLLGILVGKDTIENLPDYFKESN